MRLWKSQQRRARNGRRRATVALVSFCTLAGALLASASASAAVPAEFGSLGSGAGQLNGPVGIAINQESGAVYVADRQNNRIDKWTAEGQFLLAWGWGVADGKSRELQTCTSTCFAGIVEGMGVNFNPQEEVTLPDAVAVDNDVLSASHGDVYVVNGAGNRRVEKFSATGEFLLTFGREVNETTKGNVCLAGERCKQGVEGGEGGQFEEPLAVAVGADGTVYVGDNNRVQEFTPEGVFLTQVSLPGAGATTRGLTVDAGGDLYVGSLELSGVRKYSPSGELLQTLDGEGGARTMALDASGMSTSTTRTSLSPDI